MNDGILRPHSGAVDQKEGGPESQLLLIIKISVTKYFSLLLIELLPPNIADLNPEFDGLLACKLADVLIV